MRPFFKEGGLTEAEGLDWLIASVSLEGKLFIVMKNINNHGFAGFYYNRVSYRDVKRGVIKIFRKIKLDKEIVRGRKKLFKLFTSSEGEHHELIDKLDNLMTDNESLKLSDWLVTTEKELKARV